MATSSTGCKCGVLVVVGAFLPAHHQDFCPLKQNGDALYCPKYVAEPVHTHEEGPSNSPLTWIKVTTASTGTSPTYSFASIKVGNWKDK
jgi:hypothetical protein